MGIVETSSGNITTRGQHSFSLVCTEPDHGSVVIALFKSPHQPLLSIISPSTPRAEAAIRSE